MTEQTGIVAALVAVSAQVGAIGKDHKMTDGPARYAYRSIEQITPPVHAAFIDHGVVCAPHIVESQYRDGLGKNANMRQAILTIEYVFTALDGSTLTASVMGEALDTSDKASNKALTAAWKQALVQVLCIPLENADDPDHASPQHAPGESGDPGRDEPPALPDGHVRSTEAKRAVLDALGAHGLVGDEARTEAQRLWEDTFPHHPASLHTNELDELLAQINGGR